MTKHLTTYKEQDTIENCEGSIKHDQNKPDFTYVSWEMMEALSIVRTFGEKKYSRDNWKKGGNNWINRNIAACLRHLFKHLSGEIYDSESNLPHLWHAACCIEHTIYEFAKKKK
jgi:Domain of unknown function (DUF5664)